MHSMGVTHASTLNLDRAAGCFQMPVQLCLAFHSTMMRARCNLGACAGLQAERLDWHKLELATTSKWRQPEDITAALLL